MRLFSLIALCVAVSLPSCASGDRSGGNEGTTSSSYRSSPSSSSASSTSTNLTTDTYAADASPNARATKKKRIDPSKPAPSKLVHDPDEVPVQVRAIEDLIDVKSALIADEVVIEVSKNYQFEVSLTGDRVGHVMRTPGGTDRMALGPSTAFIRNLKIKGDKRIRLRIADFGTKPFIKVTAKGHCSHIIAPPGKKPKIQRAEAILIRNDHVRYIEKQQLASFASELGTVTKN